MCLFKIIHIISSIPPSKQQPFPNNNNKGSSFDLNLRFCSITKSEESEIDQHNNEGREIEKPKFEEEVFEADDVAKTTSFRGGNSNCLDLLIEAARVLSEKNEFDSEEEREIGDELMTSRGERVKKKKERLVVVREPVVRSKRGRNQVLPCRFRDSVVEPLKRTGPNRRMSSNAKASKRLLR